jgi:hypothetical protein
MSLLSSVIAIDKASRRELRRSRLRILRLLEVTETRRASGVAWNAGNRQVHTRLEALASGRNWDIDVQTMMQTSAHCISEGQSPFARAEEFDRELGGKCHQPVWHQVTAGTRLIGFLANPANSARPERCERSVALSKLLAFEYGVSVTASP